MNTEVWVNRYLRKYIKGYDIILEQHSIKMIRLEETPEGEIREVEEDIGNIIVFVSIEEFLKRYGHIIEDDVKYPGKKLPHMLNKKFYDEQGNEIDPGYRRYILKWIDEKLESPSRRRRRR